MKHLMTEEAMQTPILVQHHLDNLYPDLHRSVQAIRELGVTRLVTIARGSSDHAAAYFSYLLAWQLGLMPASLAPSLLTLHEVSLEWKGCLALAISQSGASPDLCTALAAANAGGAVSLALVNQPQSALSRIAQFTCPMGAGDEKGIAATKSFILSLVNALLFVDIWKSEGANRRRIATLPFLLDQTIKEGAAYSLRSLRQASCVLILSRGLGFPIAQELALKMNEVCRLHALPYSTAEFRHGPMALVRAGDPVLLIGIRGPELLGILETFNFLKSLGASVLFIAPRGTPGATLVYPAIGDPLWDPILAIQLLYPLVAQLAVARGLDPDQPAYLQKVTMTV